MWKKTTYFILFLILICNFIIIISFNNRDNNHIENDLNFYKDKIEPKETNINNFDDLTSRANSRNREVSSGNWLDSFVDETNLDWGLSNNLIIKSGDAKINGSDYLDSNTIALWYFDEGTGTIIYDETMNNNDGTLGGDGKGTDKPTWTSGKYGNSLKFDGNDDYVDCGSDWTLMPSNEVTVEAWVKILDFPTWLGRVVTKGGYAGSSGYEMNVYNNTGKMLYVNVYDSANKRFDVRAGNITLNTWTHLALTYHKDDAVKLYINGEMVGSKDTNGKPIKSNGYSVFLGINKDYSSAFKGLIDDVRISKVARSAQEIKNVYENFSGSGSNLGKAYLTSKTINLPSNTNWDSLIINKTQPINTNLNITILDATNNQPIPGSPIYSSTGEFDISHINPLQYPKIKLNASFIGNGYATPYLHYWGVSWNGSKTWSDTLYGGLKIEDQDKTNIFDGEVEIQNSGYLKSNTIELPNKHYYNSLTINKEETAGGSLTVSILNSESDSEIAGYVDLTGEIIDISDINPILHPRIKLQAEYSSSNSENGTLSDWSINWVENSMPEVLDISHYSVLKRTEPVTICCNLTDCEEAECELTLEIEYKSPTDTTWQTEYLSNLIFNFDHWECVFEPPADAELGFYSFRFLYNDSLQVQYEYPETYLIEVINNKPEIIDIEILDTKIYRTETLNLKINVFDEEVDKNKLNIAIKHSPVQKMVWEMNYISNKIYNNGLWYANFIPAKNAPLGWYILNISCNDSDTEIFEHINVEVLNNQPSEPEITILPQEPTTFDDLNVIVANIKDIETPMNKLELSYKWFRDDLHIPEFDNNTIIPYIETQQHEIWRCEVFVFDGDEWFGPTNAEIIILNSPPVLIEELNKIVMDEDSTLIMEDQLIKNFQDPDQDNLFFYAEGQNNIKIKILNDNGTIELIPSRNWYGTEYITFHANDTYSIPAETTVEVIVKPVNDLPEIVQVGSQYTVLGYSELSFIAQEKERTSLPIYVRDEDGDLARGKIKYILNVSDRENLFLQNGNIIFTPSNNDVGWHYLNIKITDNNETPVKYISQNIKIHVINVNDPPTVNIIEPVNGKEFYEDEPISLICSVDDADIYVDNYNEKFSFEWRINNSDESVLGTTQELELDSPLSPGNYEITIKVIDKEGAIGYDSVQITIKDSSKRNEDILNPSKNSSLLIGLIIIIIIIIICLLAFVLNKKKKKKIAKLGISKQQVLEPSGIFTPKLSKGTPVTNTLLQQSKSPSVQGTPISPTPNQELLKLVGSSSGAKQAPAQLPPAKPVGQAGSSSTTVTPKIKNDSKLSPKQLLKLFDERLARGEIDQDVYLNLKAKYEMEAKKYQPAPQLPPASNVTTTNNEVPNATQVKSTVAIKSPQVIQPGKE